MSILDPIRAAVAAASTVVTGAIALLNDLHERLQQALADDDTAAVQEIADELGARTSELAAAIAANTAATVEPDAPNAGDPEFLTDPNPAPADDSGAAASGEQTEG